MNGVFAVEKPSGITSAQFLSHLNRIFTNSKIFANDLAEIRANKLHNYNAQKGTKNANRHLRNMKIKMGHGGTLDPLASGVLIVGVGLGTKKLQAYLNGSIKTYETEALLGGSTTTGDCEGQLLTKNPVKHVLLEHLQETCEKFTGDLKQTPPIFSALKMNGKPLYEYAREGLAIPRKIEAREVKVYELALNDKCMSREHDYQFLRSEVDEDGVPLDAKLSGNPTLNEDILYFSKQYMEKMGLSDAKVEAQVHLEGKEAEELSDPSYRAPILHFTATVSSGTYIRSLISDFGKALGSSAYMVKLIRSRQGEWYLNKNVFSASDFEKDERIWGPALKRVLDCGGEVDLKKEMEVSEESVEKDAVDEEVDEEAGETTEKDTVEETVERKVEDSSSQNNEEHKAEDTEVNREKRRKVE